MVYLEKKKIGRETYFYLVKNVRLKGKFKKFRIYLGKGEIPKGELKRSRLKYSKILGKRADDYLASKDPLSGLLTKKEIEDLDNIKKNYKKIYKKIPKEIRKKHYEDFLIRFTYNTNAIEGSTITLNETKLILLDKITPPNRTLREVKEVENHKKAFDFVFNHKGDMTKNFVLKTHCILTDEILPKETSGKFRKVQVVITGVEKRPPKPEHVNSDFKQLLKWYNKNKKKYHPVVLTSYFHSAFEGIHPFVDFNGRAGRLLLNFILMKRGYPIIDIKNKDRLRYYESLERAQDDNVKPLVELTVKYLKEELSRIS